MNITERALRQLKQGLGSAAVGFRANAPSLDDGERLALVTTATLELLWFYSSSGGMTPGQFVEFIERAAHVVIEDEPAVSALQ